MRNQNDRKNIRKIVNSKGDRYIVGIGIGVKRVYIGTYDTLPEALIARKEAERFFHNESISLGN